MARYFLREVGSPPKWCDTPPPLVLSFAQAHLCDTPFCNVSRDNCAIPHKNKHEIFLRYYRYKFRNARLFIILFVRNFLGVCSQFWLSVRNFAEVLLIEIQEEIHHFAVLGEGGVKGCKFCEQKFCEQTGVSYKYRAI